MSFWYMADLITSQKNVQYKGGELTAETVEFKQSFGLHSTQTYDFEGHPVFTSIRLLKEAVTKFSSIDLHIQRLPL